MNLNELRPSALGEIHRDENVSYQISFHPNPYGLISHDNRQVCPHPRFSPAYGRNHLRALISAIPNASIKAALLSES